MKSQGVVLAYAVEPVDQPFAGRLSYFADGDRLETISFCTQPEFRGMGCAKEMVKALRRAYPGISLASSPARPTQLGHDTLIGLREKGLID